MKTGRLSLGAPKHMYDGEEAQLFAKNRLGRSDWRGVSRVVVYDYSSYDNAQADYDEVHVFGDGGLISTIQIDGNIPYRGSHLYPFE